MTSGRNHHSKWRMPRSATGWVGLSGFSRISVRCRVGQNRSFGLIILSANLIDGTLATSYLDFDLYLCDGIPAVSVALSAGIRVGERLDILMSDDAPHYDEMMAQLKAVGQEHLLRFWSELDGESRRELARQLTAIDFRQIAALYGQGAGSCDWAALARQASPPAAMRLAERRGSGGRFTAEDARARAGEALRAGKVGVLLVAGGQGSRLGFEHPKGMYPIGPLSKASLLQIHFEKALAAAKQYDAAVPIYMMTSPVTHDEQTEFLKHHKRFGLPEDDVVLFCQGTMPAVDASNGELLLAEKGSLFLSPDGHGGTVAALAASGAIEHMRRRGIEHLFYLQVDNPLTPICDAEFVGYHLLAESELTSMAVAKQTPQDRLGVFATIDNQMQVIEYSDLPDDVASARDSVGSLRFWAGSIAVHVFSVAFLERALALKNALPFHIARKKVPFVDATGSLVHPKEPNALKFERFIFDLLPHARNPLVVEFEEREVFAPLKNAPGAERDTPEYVQRLMVSQHRRWLEAAGTRVAEGVAVEISPVWALDAEGVAERNDQPSVVDRPTYLRE
jgi:UDP-N-acetylglucosamine/UDP-N-acetylgalactosamine diphosphorylase